MNLTKLADEQIIRDFRIALEKVKLREIATGDRDATCDKCFGSGFRRITGGVVKCECRVMTDEQRERIALMLEHMPPKLADSEYKRLCTSSQK